MRFIGKTLPLLVASLVASLGCSDRILDDEQEVDTDAPVVTITKPERGTIVPDYQIEVAGRVEDRDSLVTGLEINGMPVDLDDDGTFRTLVQVGDGVSLIRTVATDVDGNKGTDTRSVMAGNLVPLDTPSFDGIAARMGRSTFESINKTMVNLLEDPEAFTKLADSFNPLVDAGSSCLGLDLHIDSASMEKADVSVLPVSGGIVFNVDLDGADIEIGADFAVACANGDTVVKVTADHATLSGRIDVGMDRGQMYMDLGSITSTFQELHVDVGGLSSDILDSFLSDPEALAADAVEKIVGGKIERIVEGFMSGIDRGWWTVSLAGTELKFGASPTMVEFNDDGGFMAVDTSVTAVGLQDAIAYVSTPSDAPVLEMRDYAGFRAVIADDFVNQAFAAFWGTGALDKAVAFDSSAMDKQSVLGKAIDRVEVTALVPPYVDARDPSSLSVTFGDILVDVIDATPAEDRVVTRLALSGRVSLAVDVDDENRLKLRTDAPELWVDVLGASDGVSGANPFDRDDIEVLASFVAGRFVSAADDLIEQIPIPSVAGTTVQEAQLAPDRGYMIVGGELHIPD